MMAKSCVAGGYYFQISADKYPEYKYAKKFVCYWHKIEWKFKLRRMLGRPEFKLDFKHDIMSDVIYDDGVTIRNIADFYGYRITEETLSTTKSTYRFKTA